MVAFSFNGKWLPDLTDKERKLEVFRLIRSGEKKTTIRPAKQVITDPEEETGYCVPRAREGDKLQLYWKQRTRDCELIAEKVCGRPYQILIDSDRKADVEVVSWELGIDCAVEGELLDDLIKNDGFKSKADFAKFFGYGYYYVYPLE